MIFARTVSLICLCLTFTACGFSLRSNEVLTAKFSALELDLAQPNSEVAQLLQDRLEIASVSTSNSSPASQQTNIPVLQIGPEQFATRPVSVNPRARAAQYELRMSIEAALIHGADLLMGPDTLLVERSYFEDIENIAGNQEELEIIASEMRRELVSQLLRRLEAVEI